MILKFEFDYAGEGDYFAFLLDFWAKKSGLKYALTKANNPRGGAKISLFVEGSDAELARFSDEYISNVPHSIFIRESKVELAEDFKFDSALEDFKFETQFKFGLVTPLALKTGENEFGFKFDPAVVEAGVRTLSAGESFIYGDYEISPLDSFECDFIMPTNINLLPKIFVADEKSLIALASFEKPIVRLRTTALYRSAHESAPLNFAVRAAWDANLHKICEALKGINFLKVRGGRDDFSVFALEDSFMVARGKDFLSADEKAFLASKNDKNLALFALALKEHGWLDHTAASVFFSRTRPDFIKVFRGEDEFEALKIIMPSSFEELYTNIRTFEGGEQMLSKIGEKIALPSGQITSVPNFYGIFELVAQILHFERSVCDLASEFGGIKGVRIEYKMSGKNELDVTRLIRSAMSFYLAGADAKNISFGALENLALFLSDFGDVLKDELECDRFALLGSLFESVTLANLTLKYCNSNFSTKFSERYPLEIS